MLQVMMFQVNRGLYFGYPQCCIMSFCNNQIADRKRPTERQFRAANGTGFVPCKACTEKILSGKIRLEQLIKNRECSVEFPHASSSHGRY